MGKSERRNLATRRDSRERPAFSERIIMGIVLAGDIEEAGRILTDACYGAAQESGWHNDLKTGQPRTPEQNDELFPVRIALCHSELSEALEGHRKGLMDDKIPTRSMAEVELADGVIRVFDVGGAMGYDLGATILEKLEVNRARADHKPENWRQSGGKTYWRKLLT